MTDSFSIKSIQTLELPAILEMLSHEAVSEEAKQQALALLPSSDGEEVRRMLTQTTAACGMMTVKGSPSFSSVKEIRPALARAGLGGSLNTRELLEVAGVLRASRLVKGYIAEDFKEKSPIDYLFNALRTNRFLEDQISGAIVAEDEFSDHASPELADIRRKMRAASTRAREALAKIISSPSYAKALQENIITMRSDRYVVPVKAEHKGDIPGLVHDVSASGATLFVEPMAAVKANNELRELMSQEKAEIERILAELSAECAEHREDLESDYLLLVQLDLLFAKAKLSFRLDCGAAEVTERQLYLKRARHPLLPKDRAVPIDVELGKDYDTLIITGPNTGGKTVSLKTIGLLALMNQCGLHIPASDGSTLPVFSHILADIGDEQSIEQSLSTFSSHMSNIVNILSVADDKSLVLFDELGAGTDPAEGAALAVAVIEKVRAAKALVVATTHYTELKVYASNTPGVQNASCEFDVDTLRPTYRLLIGIPGKSNAFAISRRLGLDENVIRDAQSRMGTSAASFEATIEKLEQTRAGLEDRYEQAEKHLRAAEEKDKKSSQLKAELEVRLEKANLKASREAEEIIRQARQTADEVYRELDRMRSEQNEKQSAEEINEARNALRSKLKKTEESFRREVQIEDPRKSSRELRIGDIVQIKSMGAKGTVTGISKDRKVSLRSGIMNVTIPEEDLLLLENEKAPVPAPARAGSTSFHAEAVPHEVDLRGMESMEATAVAEQFLDNAYRASLSPVCIIHGKGTGALRSAIHRMLKKNKIVKSYRLGNFGEGESGVTIVELKGK